jgi:hypothetical protein
MSDRLTEIRERLDACFRAKCWHVDPEEDPAFVWGDVAGPYVVAVCHGSSPNADAALIANAPADLAYLVSELEREKRLRHEEQEPMRLFASSLEALGSMPEDYKKLREENERLKSIAADLVNARPVLSDYAYYARDKYGDSDAYDHVERLIDFIDSEPK